MGEVLNVNICPTISTSSWENNCFLMELEDALNTKARKYALTKHFIGMHLPRSLEEL